MTLRTFVCAAIAFLGAALPAAAGAASASAIRLTPLNADGTVAASSGVVVTCEAIKGGMLDTAPSTGTLRVTAGSFASGQPSTSVTFALIPGTSTYSASSTWTTPASGSATARCEVGTTFKEITVSIAAPRAAAPVISAIDAPTGPLFSGEQATLTAVASDPEGRPLAYTWSTSSGALAADGASAVFTAPALAGTSLVQVTATNDAGVSATRSVGVQVLFSAYRDALPAAIEGPREIAATAEGDLFVADARGRLHRLTKRGERVATSLSGVTAVATADGVLFVAVPGAILKLDPFTGRLIGRIELGASRPPSALAYDAARSILWMVNPTGSVEGVRPDGAPVLTIPVRMPTDVAVDASGLVWVALEKNEGGSMVHAFSPTTGAKVREIVPSGQGAGAVAIAGGIAVDAAGRIFVSDFFSGTVQVVSADGTLVASLGQYGSAPGSLRQPAGLAHLANGDLVVANMDLGRIDRFGTNLPLPVCAGDADCDGLPDGFESAHGLDPNDPTDALADLDGDGLNNAEELVYGTSPDAADTDGDGFADAQELASGFDPADPNDHRPRIAIDAPGTAAPGLVRMAATVSDPIADRGACSTAWAQLAGTPVALREASTASPSFVARAGAYRFRAVATCGGATSLPADVDVTVSNVAPVADGGRLLTLPAGGRATLSGQLSSDANGDALTFVWDQVLGAPVIGTIENKSFSARMQEPGYYVFRLGATDPASAEGVTEVPVLVLGPAGAPVAVVSTPVAAQALEAVTLDATGSYAAAGAIFQWQQVHGSAVTLANATSASPSFVPPAAGRYGFEVTVAEGALRSPPARVDVYAAEPGFALPVAQIAFPGVAAVGAPIALDGTGSTAGTNGALAYAWRQVSGPAGGLTERESATATFVAFAPGSYELELVVDDGVATSRPARVRFEARQGGKPIPVAAASAPGTAVVGDLVTLDGGASTGAARFRWTQVDGPWVAVHQTRVTHFVPPAAGLYGFELEVDDGAVVSAPVRVNVMVFANPTGGK